MHVPCFSLRSIALGLGAALALGSFAAEATDSTDRLSAPAPEPAARRLIVRFRDQATGAALQREIDHTMGSAMVRAGTPSGTGRPALRAEVAHLRRLGTGADLLELPDSLPQRSVQRLVEELAADPAVHYVEVDTRQQIDADPGSALPPNDPLYASHQWHFHDPVGGVNAPAAWTMSRGAGVVVAVVDTGLIEHPDFDPHRVLEGYDFISEKATSRRPTDGRAPGGRDRGDWTSQAGECSPGSVARGSSWHGTHVAGTIAQATNNGTGAAGLAPEVILLPIRALGRCGGWTSDIIDSLVWASGGRVAGVPDNPWPADIINLSLGGEGACPRAYQEAIDAAVGRGTLVVVAAGNSAVDVATRQPASCRNIVNVASTGATGRMASYSDYGNGVDVSAPGGDFNGPVTGLVWQAASTGATTPESGEYTYLGKAGTSMAAPHVAAVAALVQSARIAAGRSALSPAKMEDLLVRTARAFPTAPVAGKPIGSGIVDAAAALRAALDGNCDIAKDACAIAPAELVPQVPASGQSSAAGAGGRRYTFTAKAGRPVRVFTYGGRGNAALYVRQGAPATAAQFDARSARPGSYQAVLIRAPVDGVYHVLLEGAPSYEGVTIALRQ